MNFGLNGKVAVVTGAARGIGRATVLALAAEGARVVVSDIDKPAADQVAEEVRALGADALALKADVTDAGQVGDMVSRVLEWSGRLDVLVNNAGIAYESGGPIVRSLFWETSIQQRDKEILLALVGTMNCSRAVVEHMIKSRGGSIVNLASAAGETGNMKRISVYGAAKGGVIAFTRLLASELGSYNVRVNAVSPGFIKTTRDLMAERGKDKNPNAYQAYRNSIDSVTKDLPLGRPGEASEIANAIVFLASDASSYVTGQTLSVNGGLVMR